MEERLLTQWEKLSAVAQALMFLHGPVDTEPIGTSMLLNQMIHRGVMKLFSICIASVSKHGLEGRIGITAAAADWCTCSPRQTLTHSHSLCWKPPNQWDCNVFRTRMVA